jgi:hypothetical protein
MMIYAACYDTMNELVGYLTENCCGGGTSQVACKPVRTKRTKSSV